MKNSKTTDNLKKGESFVSPSGLIWKVDEVRPIGRGKVEVVSSRDKNKVAFSFRTDEVIEVVT